MTNVEQLKEIGETLLKDRFRVRLVDQEMIPLCYKHFIGDQQVIVIDLPEAEGYEAAAAEAYKRLQSIGSKAGKDDHALEADKENLPADCVLDGDPLQVTFLSIEKLDQMAALNKSRFDNGLELTVVGGHSGIDVHAIPALEAHGLINEFAVHKFLPDEFAQHSIVFCCEATNTQPVLFLARQNNGKQLSTTRALYFDDFYASIDEVHELGADLNDKYSLRKMCCRCHFNVLDALMLVERGRKDDGNFVPAMFAIAVEWNPDRRFAGSGGNLKRPEQQQQPAMKHKQQQQYLQMPPNNAVATVKFKPGWMDGRIFLTDRINELRFLAQLAAHLKAGTLPWQQSAPTTTNGYHQQQADLLERAAHLIANSKDKLDAQPVYPFDFTDRLWDVLKLAKSADALRRVFQQVYDQLQSGEFRVLVEPNKVSSLAKMLRVRNAEEMIFPRLEPMTCLQLLIEIGVDRFNGELTHRFLTGDFLPNTLDLEPFFLHSSASLEARIDRLIPLHLALQSIIMIELYVKMPPHEKTNMAKKLLAHFTTMEGNNAFEKEFVCKTNMEDIRFEKLKDTMSDWILERDFDKWVRPGVLSKCGSISDVVHIAKHLGVRHFAPFGGNGVAPPASDYAPGGGMKTEALSPDQPRQQMGCSPPQTCDGGTAKLPPTVTTSDHFECAYILVSNQSSALFSCN